MRARVRRRGRAPGQRHPQPRVVLERRARASTACSPCRSASRRASSPVARIVDLRREGGHAPHVISQGAARAHGRARWPAKEQVILFLNRRGFSPFVQCRDCGWVGRCASCDLTLTYHQAGHRACAATTATTSSRRPRPAPAAAASAWTSRGWAPSAWRREVARLFPEARIERMDFDSTRRRGRARGALPPHARGRDRRAAGNADGRQGTRLPARRRWSAW